MLVNPTDSTYPKPPLGLIALVTWNTRRSHSIFNFKYNNYKHFRRLGSFGWRLLQFDKIKIFLKHLGNSSFKFHPA